MDLCIAGIWEVSYTRQIFSREQKYSSWRSFTIIFVWLAVSHRNINRGKGSKVKETLAKHDLKLNIGWQFSIFLCDEGNDGYDAVDDSDDEDESNGWGCIDRGEC